MDQKAYPAHNVFEFDDGVRFSSNFDNGNLARVERSSSRSHEFRIWTSSDCAGEPFQAKNSNAWFHFLITGLPAPTTLRIQIVNASNHSGLYKHDMRPVYRSNSTNQRWTRLKNSVVTTVKWRSFSAGSLLSNIAHSQPNLYVRAKRQTASQDQLRLFPFCSPAVGEDSLGEPPPCGQLWSSYRVPQTTTTT